MNPRTKASLGISLLLFMMLISAGMIEASGIGTIPLHSLHKAGGVIRANSRKLLGLDAVLDYDYAGPNPKHDPRGRRGGGGSRNP
ncbi:UNVERIFIED_CONTAM: hypothetical protein Sradi_6310900 [Sesamum radiatum]|uniref:Transmembrane protein n=1 Tax=Sesamum radiatum TaxID=300843 RepID=A0AAW2KD73_SESRA